MDRSQENTSLSFERILFFSDAFIAVAFGGFAFALIPLIANLLYRKTKEAKA
jgi:hypothetical protein